MVEILLFTNAAKEGLLEVLKFMINHSKCNLLATNKRGKTILHCAGKNTLRL